MLVPVSAYTQMVVTQGPTSNNNMMKECRLPELINQPDQKNKSNFPARPTNRSFVYEKASEG